VESKKVPVGWKRKITREESATAAPDLKPWIGIEFFRMEIGRYYPPNR